MKRLVAATLVTAALAVGAPIVYSQNPDTAAAAAGKPAQRHHGERAFHKPTERVEARLAYLRTALKITDAQQPQWDAYAGVLRKHAADMEHRFEARRAQVAGQGGERRRATVVERHERQRARLATAAQRLDELLAAEKPLYAALSTEQQSIADEVLSPRGRGGHGGRGARGGFHHRASFGRG